MPVLALTVMASWLGFDTFFDNKINHPKLHAFYNTHSRSCYPVPVVSNSSFNKKDGYRQQNVHQLQKLISIIDYDVCMAFY